VGIVGIDNMVLANSRCLQLQIADSALTLMSVEWDVVCKAGLVGWDKIFKNSSNGLARGWNGSGSLLSGMVSL
jgi:hypothetical protein